MQKYGCRADIETAYFLVALQLCNLFPHATFHNQQRNLYHWINSFIVEAATCEYSAHLINHMVDVFGRHYNIRNVKSAVGMARVFASLWCDHEAHTMPSLRSKCHVIESQLHNESQALNASQLPNSLRGTPLPRVHKRSFDSDFFQRADMIAAVQEVVASSAQCGSLPRPLLDASDHSEAPLTRLEVDSSRIGL